MWDWHLVMWEILSETDGNIAQQKDNIAYKSPGFVAFFPFLGSSFVKIEQIIDDKFFSKWCCHFCSMKFNLSREIWALSCIVFIGLYKIVGHELYDRNFKVASTYLLRVCKCENEKVKTTHTQRYFWAGIWVLGIVIVCCLWSLSLKLQCTICHRSCSEYCCLLQNSFVKDEKNHNRISNLYLYNSQISTTQIYQILVLVHTFRLVNFLLW